MIRFTVPGNPKALKRHRPRKWGGNYNPSEGDKADFLAVSREHAPPIPSNGPVQLFVHAYFQRPKSHYRTGKYSGQLKPYMPEVHTYRPDADNILKFVGDALDGVFWRNDSVIFQTEVIKLYSESPRIEIAIVEVSSLYKSNHARIFVVNDHLKD